MLLSCDMLSGVAPELVKQENLLHSIAAALHLSTQPITGQTATPAQLQRNAAVSVNVEQPLMQVSRSSSTLCLNKKFTLFIFCDNFPSCKLIQIIFGRNTAEKIWNKLTHGNSEIYSLCC